MCCCSFVDDGDVVDDVVAVAVDNGDVVDDVVAAVVDYGVFLVLLS